MSQGMNNNSQFPFNFNPLEPDQLLQLFASSQQSQPLFNQEILQQYLRLIYLTNLQPFTSKDPFLSTQALNFLNQTNQNEIPQIRPPINPQPNFNQQQLILNQKYKNNAQNPITVDDDEPQQPTKNCHNSLCKNQADKKIKSKRNDIIYFCEKCSKLYNKGNFCDFCEQVYGSYDDEAGWIQCDSCQKWNHIACEQKNRNENIRNEPESTPYNCLSCSKNVKKPKISKKTDEPPIYKQRLVLEQEDNLRNREKNITFVATKDNKIQYTFRYNLLEEEIRSDLEQLRNQTKKVKKLQTQSNNITQNQYLQSNNQIQQQQSQQQQSQQQQQQQQQQENQESQPTNRSLRRRQNQKVNYRDLVGEY